MEDSEKILDIFMEERGSRDITTQLDELRSTTTWKTAPKASTLAAYADLFGY